MLVSALIALIALVDVAAKRRRAAALHRGHDAALHPGHVMPLTIGVAVAAEHIRHFRPQSTGRTLDGVLDKHRSRPAPNGAAFYLKPNGGFLGLIVKQHCPLASRLVTVSKRLPTRFRHDLDTPRDDIDMRDRIATTPCL